MPGQWTLEWKCPALSEMNEQRGKQHFGPGSLRGPLTGCLLPALSVGLVFCGDTSEGLQCGTQQGEGRLLLETSEGLRRAQLSSSSFLQWGWGGSFPTRPPQPVTGPGSWRTACSRAPSCSSINSSGIFHSTLSHMPRFCPPGP